MLHRCFSTNPHTTFSFSQALKQTSNNVNTANTLPCYLFVSLSIIVYDVGKNGYHNRIIQQSYNSYTTRRQEQSSNDVNSTQVNKQYLNEGSNKGNQQHFN